jgi:hypothetical protein
LSTRRLLFTAATAFAVLPDSRPVTVKPFAFDTVIDSGPRAGMRAEASLRVTSVRVPNAASGSPSPAVKRERERDRRRRSDNLW